MSEAVSSVSRSMRMSSGPRARNEKPRTPRSSCMLDTPRSASTPSAGGKLRSANTSPICEKLACTNVTLSPNSASRLRAISSACVSRSRPTSRPPAPSRRAISIACPPSPTVASTYSPPGLIASQSIVSSTSTGLCSTFKLDAQFVQNLQVVVRNRALLQVLQRPAVIPNFQVRQVPHHVHIAFHLSRFPQHRRNQDPSLAIDFHRLAVIVRPGQELLLGTVVRREPRQLALQFLPDFHWEDPGVITGFARNVELPAKSLELFQKGRGYFETALLVHSCRYVSP